MYIADTLSRTTDNREADDIDDLCNEKVVHAQQATDVLSTETLNQLREATAADPVLQTLRETLDKGWPRKRRSVDNNLHSYWPMRHNISTENVIMMVSDTIIIPNSFKQVILEKQHIAHQGIQRTKAKARRVLYWPGMTRDIELMIEKCGPCQQLQPQQQKEPLIAHDISELPWTKVGTDIFELRGQFYLLLVDYLTKYPEVLNIPDKSAHTVIQKMKSVFARHGQIFRRNRRHLQKIHQSLFRDTDPEHSEDTPPQRLPADPPSQDHPAEADDSSVCHTRSGRAVVRPTRFKDFVMEVSKE
ncbi:hypothetical protein ACEWY4_003804 [Coilia grayii]|uniref:Gypsy retrotransposon integrase-like protein 1 n=1 Tax=Coilia grayii TaxID=363190 RepID=A0ABD1KS93_9TELE